MNKETTQTRLTALMNSQPEGIVSEVIQQITRQQGKARFDAEWVAQMCQTFHCSTIDFALACLPVAACYADPSVSQFYVGAIAIGQSGTFYFGANQEFAGEAIQQTIHAEQSAIMHAWLAGESRLTDIVVNYTPCGHCRQFMNELNSAKELHIHLPHQQYNLLHSYLPDAFGPKDLNIEKVLFDPQQHGFTTQGDPLVQAAIMAANQSYAPYSQALSGVALQVGEQIITGRYAENAAFNPSFLPLQSALNYRRFSGLAEMPVTRVVLAEQNAILSHQKITAALVHKCFDLELEYISLNNN